MHIYEYIFTGVIIVCILGASIAMIGYLAQPTQDALNKELLKSTTDKVMTQILIDSGYPFNWGYDGSVPQAFGLAKYGLTSREAFLLDPDKVQRLNKNIGGEYLEPKTVLNRLNLGLDYGFTIEISRILDIGLTKQTGEAAVFDLVVTSSTNFIPLKNANVTAALYGLSGETVVKKADVITSTGFEGNCTLDFSLPSSSYDVAIVSVDYYGLHTTQVIPVGIDAVSAFLIGNRLQTAQSYLPLSQHLGQEVIANCKQRVYAIDNFAVGVTENSGQLAITNKPESTTVAVLVPATNPEGHVVLLAGFRDLNISYRSIEAVQSASFSYSLQRQASIAGTNCMVTLYLWRMSI